MQVGTGKSILNGIAIGKLKIYKKKDTVISTAQVATRRQRKPALKRPGPRPLTSRLPCMKRHWPRQARTLPRCSTSMP